MVLLSRKYVKTENKITYFEPQAVLDAKKDAKMDSLPLLAGLTFASSIYGTMIIAREELGKASQQ